MGVSSIQAAESSFCALKHYEKVGFGQKTPTFNEMIPVFIKVLKDQHKKRLAEVETKRTQIHDDKTTWVSDNHVQTKPKRGTLQVKDSQG